MIFGALKIICSEIDWFEFFVLCEIVSDNQIMNDIRGVEGVSISRLSLYPV